MLAVVDSLLNTSYYLFAEGRFKDSFATNLKSLQLSMELENDRYTATAYGYLGYDYLYQGDTLAGLKSFENAHEIALKIGDSLMLANTFGDLASLYAGMSGMEKKGRQYTLKAMDMYERMKDTIGLQYVYYNYADGLNSKGKHDEMKVLLDKLNSSMFDRVRDTGYRAGINTLMADYFIAKNDTNRADSVLLATIELGQRQPISNELERSYFLYSQSLADQKKYKQAYEYRLKYEQVHDANLKEKNSAENKRLAAAFQIDQFRKELEQSENQNQLQEEKMKSQTLFNYILIAVSMVAFTGFIIIFLLSRKRKELNQLLRAKNREYLEAKAQSEQLARVKSDFFSTVSHELRTPLYGVIGLSSILLENNTDKSKEDDLRSLKFSADYLLALINDVLQINKIDSNKIDDEQIDFDVKELIEKIVITFEYMKRQNNNQIYIHLPADLPKKLHGNATRLSQILMNLIGNANKFTENGRIDIRLQTTPLKNDRVKIAFSVKDNGAGISKSKQQHVFEEFKQGDSHSYNYQGTGLGLPIVKRLLELSGSSIQLESELGVGSEFSFELSYPVVEAADQSNDQIDSTPEEPAKIVVHTDELQGKNILIAEDNRINQMVTKKILEKEGVNCAIAENGQEAIEALQKQDFDLVLMDVNMPVMDGLEATLEIRQFSDVPIVALTAVEIEEMRESIMVSGMNDIIVKPYDVKAFKKIIVKNLNPHLAHIRS
ncbi:response regulator [Nonlabens xiamenensis]|uniref:response regulator n=1 Tax=Nonlabens xiamenensis TaxID=2341043 RepID=UPI000F60D5DC|nr:response regulator [Nonlabens xiamenensis]